MIIRKKFFIFLSIASLFISSLVVFYFFSGKFSNNKKIVVLSKNKSNNSRLNKGPLDFLMDIQYAINQVYKKYISTLVRIELKNRSSLKNHTLYRTGFFISSNGLILTTYNNLIINKNLSKKIEVSYKGKAYKAKIIGYDIPGNLLILKINHKNDSYIPVLNSISTTEVGNFCISIGKGFSFKQDNGFISLGIISGLNRLTHNPMDRYSLFKNLIQTDIPMVTESEGGPLFNIKGEFIGLNINFFGERHNYGIGFSISANQIRKLIPTLIKGKFIKRGFLGIIGQTISSEVQDFLKINYGIVISKIIPDESADKAGLKSGDIILSINDKKIYTFNDLVFLISSFLKEETIKVKFLRNKQEMIIDIKLNTYTLDEKNNIGTLNLSKKKNTLKKKEDIKYLNWLGMKLELHEDTIKVLKIKKNSPSSNSPIPLKANDLILSINLKKKLNLKFFSSLKKSQSSSFLLEVKRKDIRFFTLIKTK